MGLFDSGVFGDIDTSNAAPGVNPDDLPVPTFFGGIKSLFPQFRNPPAAQATATAEPEQAPDLPYIRPEDLDTSAADAFMAQGRAGAQQDFTSDNPYDRFGGVGINPDEQLGGRIQTPVGDLPYGDQATYQPQGLNATAPFVNAFRNWQNSPSRFDPESPTYRPISIEEVSGINPAFALPNTIGTAASLAGMTFGGKAAGKVGEELGASPQVVGGLELAGQFAGGAAPGLALREPLSMAARETRAQREATQRAQRTPEANDIANWQEGLAAEAATRKGISLEPESFDRMAEIGAAAKAGGGNTYNVYQGSGRTERGSVYNEFVPQEPVLGQASYNAFDPEVAKQFGPNVTQHTVTLNNPLTLRDDAQYIPMARAAGMKYPNPFGLPVAEQSAELAKLRHFIEQGGHDGVVVKMDERGDNAKVLRNLFGDDQVIDFKRPAAAPPPTPEAPVVARTPPTAAFPEGVEIPPYNFKPPEIPPRTGISTRADFITPEGERLAAQLSEQHGVPVIDPDKFIAVNGTIRDVNGQLVNVPENAWDRSALTPPAHPSPTEMRQRLYNGGIDSIKEVDPDAPRRSQRSADQQVEARYKAARDAGLALPEREPPTGPPDLIAQAEGGGAGGRIPPPDNFGGDVGGHGFPGGGNDVTPESQRAAFEERFPTFKAPEREPLGYTQDLKPVYTPEELTQAIKQFNDDVANWEKMPISRRNADRELRQRARNQQNGADYSGGGAGGNGAGGAGTGEPPPWPKNPADAKRTIRSRVIDQLENVINLPRTLMTTVDASLAGRQGIMVGPRHPVEFFSNLGRGIRSMGSDAFADAWQAKVDTAAWRKYGDDLIFTAPAKPGAALNTREEAFMSDIPLRIPGLRRLNRANIMFLNGLRSDVMDTFVKATERSHEGTAPLADVQKYASFVNEATGRGNLGGLKNPAVLTAMNNAFFSMRFAISRPQSLAHVMSRPGTPAWNAVVQDVGAYMAAGATTLWLAKQAGADVGLDPRATDFGEIKVGPLHVDVWGGFRPFVVAAYREATGESKSSAGKVYDNDRGKVAAQFLANKFAPQTTIALKGTGGLTPALPDDAQKYLGLDWKPGDEMNVDAATNYLAPMFIQDLADSIWKDGLTGAIKGGEQRPDATKLGAIAGPASFFGLGANTYDTFQLGDLTKKLLGEFEQGGGTNKEFFKLQNDVKPYWAQRDDSDKTIWKLAQAQNPKFAGYDDVNAYEEQFKQTVEKLGGDTTKITDRDLGAVFGAMGKANRAYLDQHPDIEIKLHSLGYAVPKR